LSRSGELVLQTEHGKICFHQPTAYQWDQGNRQTVPVHYRRIRKQQFGFAVAAYDTEKILVIDPVLNAEHTYRKVLFSPELPEDPSS
ncbi:MAG TPA: hypothetical protein VFV92_11300, partial [Candidatus Bathyarchaeia archaeon]|nr:hypothetical protein [Candidatus Bathyarchaeia archaeon]